MFEYINNDIMAYTLIYLTRKLEDVYFIEKIEYTSSSFRLLNYCFVQSGLLQKVKIMKSIL